MSERINDKHYCLHQMFFSEHCHIKWLVRTFLDSLKPFFFIGTFTPHRMFLYNSKVLFFHFFVVYFILCQYKKSGACNSYKWGGWRECSENSPVLKYNNSVMIWVELLIASRVLSSHHAVLSGFLCVGLVNRDGAVPVPDAATGVEGTMSQWACVTFCARWSAWQWRFTGLGGLPLVIRPWGQRLVLTSCFKTLHINAWEQHRQHRLPYMSVEVSAGR